MASAVHRHSAEGARVLVLSWHARIPRKVSWGSAARSIFTPLLARNNL
jgi:hypothetical protein